MFVQLLVVSACLSSYLVGSFHLCVVVVVVVVLLSLLCSYVWKSWRRRQRSTCLRTSRGIYKRAVVCKVENDTHTDIISNNHNYRHNINIYIYIWLNIKQISVA